MLLLMAVPNACVTLQAEGRATTSSVWVALPPVRATSRRAKQDVGQSASSQEQDGG
jgi:hypothetical protein